MNEGPHLYQSYKQLHIRTSRKSHLSVCQLFFNFLRRLPLEQMFSYTEQQRNMTCMQYTTGEVSARIGIPCQFNQP